MNKFYMIKNAEEDNEYYTWLIKSNTIVISHNEIFANERHALTSFRYHAKRLIQHDLSTLDIVYVTIGKDFKTFSDFLKHMQIKWDFHFNKKGQRR